MKDKIDELARDSKKKNIRDLFRGISPYIHEIIGDHQCGFQRNRSATGQIFFILQILEKK
jgi:hypothetical protein